MAILKGTPRGLQDIRTLSGKVDQASSHPHKAYMRLSCLEMEKWRRGEERKSAAHRIKNIDARFKEIRAEEARILRSLSQCKKDNSSSASCRGSQPDRDTGGFKIKY